MRTLLLAICVLFAGTQAHAQDCTFSQIFTSATTGTSIGNLSSASAPACNTWVVSYTANGFSALSLQLEGAPDSSGTAGTFAAFSSAQTVEGTNPLTDIHNAYNRITGYTSWVRINVTAVTGSGSISVKVYGYRGSGPGFSQGQRTMAGSVPVVVASDQTPIPVTPSSPTGTQDVNIKQVAGTSTVNGGLAGTLGTGGAAAVGAAPTSNPLPQGQIDGNGFLITPDYCTKKATFTTSASGSVQLVAVSGSTTTRICHIDFTGDTITIAKIVSGTGATCTSPTDETGVITGPGGGTFGFAMDYASPLFTTASKTVCLNLSAGSTGGGTVLYSQR